MRPSVSFEVTSTRSMRTIMRSGGSGASTAGVKANGLECDLCHVGCTFLPPHQQAACHALCNATLCP